MSARDDLLLGLYPDLPAEDYHAIQALSAGGLKRLRQSPLHFWAARIDPNRAPTEPTPAMRAGTLAHCALLEPQTLAERYLVKPAGLDMRTKKGKAWAASLEGKPIEWISGEQHATALRQAAAVRALPEIASLMENGFAESSAFWIDEATGEHCKCRPDWVSEASDDVVLIDLKTAQEASPGGFPRTIANFAYHLQAAHYSDGFEKATGRMVLGFVFAVVESDPPHAAAAYMLDDTSLAKARAENRRLTDLYAACKAADSWPGYPSSIQVLSLPAWAA